MCQFFSCVSDGRGKIMYFKDEERKEILAGKLNYEADSHTSIADYYGYKGAMEDKLNKYEYNPLTKIFRIDQLNTKDDSKNVERFCKKLDFATVVPELIFKPIINPLKKKGAEVTAREIRLLKKWDSVGDSVWDSVGDSVWDSVGGYTSSFFNISKWKYITHKKGENPFQPCIDLWESGFVPSFDGKTWRLHKGKKAKIVHELTPRRAK
jgi:hypothetical protein